MANNPVSSIEINARGRGVMEVTIKRRNGARSHHVTRASAIRAANAQRRALRQMPTKQPWSYRWEGDGYDGNVMTPEKVRQAERVQQSHIAELEGVLSDARWTAEEMQQLEG